MSPATGDILLRLERPLPESLPSGRPTALYLYGTCFHRYRGLVGMEIRVDGAPTPVEAFGMPRLDLFRALHPQLGAGERPVPDSDPGSSEDPEVRCYRSGFWGTVEVPAAAGGAPPIRIDALLQLEDGLSVEVELGRIEVGEPALGPAPADDSPDGLIAVCMATCNPDPELLRVQVDSLREQTDLNWRCVIGDDCSRPELFAEIELTVAGDERFSISRSERRLGVYRSFERVLGLIPDDASLVCLCDQDDRWYREKLTALRSGLRGTQLVYSDMRLVDAGGEVLSETYWTDRRNNHTNLVSLLIANSVTGAASLMRREVVERALPFPQVPGEQFHDHWLALVALTLGRVGYIDRPLYDYVQHGGAALGHAAANVGIHKPRPLRRRDPLGISRLRRRYGPSRPGYFRAYARLAVLARVLLMRCDDRLAAHKRRALARFIGAEHSPAGMLWLLVRPSRAWLGRDETLGMERMLFRGILWRHQLALRSRGAQRPAGSVDDASDPEPRATVQASRHGHTETTHIERMLEPLELAVSEREPERINILIPSIDLKHLFGGYIAKFNLARRLAESGHRVRVVTVNRAAPLAPDWRAQLESYSGLEGALSEVEFAFAREAGEPLAVNPSDRLIATTWWTAHLARDALTELRADRFLYLIQEYEPFTFPMGSLAALAAESYEFPHVALFSTELLQQFFATHGYGVYGDGAGGAEDAHSFQNAITPVNAPASRELAARESRKLLFYARSEAHARRNMFELGLLAIMRAIESGTFDSRWEYAGVGSVEGRSRILLPNGANLEILPRRSQAAYGKMLPEHDIGLALMFTPHPSLVPIEMAAAGILTVTNSFDTKTAASLEAISTNLIVARPGIDGIVAGLARAVERVDDHEARLAGARVAWSSDWRESLDDRTIERVVTLLGRC